MRRDRLSHGAAWAPEGRVDDGNRTTGAYGINLTGAVPRSDSLAAGASGWPSVRIASHRRRPPGSRTFVDDDAALLRLGDGGEVSMDRVPLSAAFTTPTDLAEDRFIHPYLAAVGAVTGHWLGREPLHGGAVVVGGGAWGVIGPNEVGKSTLLAALALSGHTVLADDLLVIEGLTAFAGPRCVDLRPASAVQLQIGDAPAVRFGQRRRLALARADPAAPLQGWVFLAWGDRIEAARAPPDERLTRLMRCRAVGRTPRDQTHLLELAQLPGWVLTRPPGWDLLGATLARLEALTAG